MIVLVTDFGIEDPYLGQMKAVLHREAPSVPVVDLFSSIPSFDIRAGAYLLAAYVEEFPAGTVFLCVVDPGVGSERAAVILEIDGRWYVGPDNGLFNVVVARADSIRWWDIVWRPERLSSSFHGRDLFAPVAAARAMGRMMPVQECDPLERVLPGWPAELKHVVYIDHYGNVITGIRASTVSQTAVIDAGGYQLRYANIFSVVPEGTPFWYENSNGLVEIAVNQGRADKLLDLHIGDRIPI